MNRKRDDGSKQPQFFVTDAQTITLERERPDSFPDTAESARAIQGEATQTAPFAKSLAVHESAAQSGHTTLISPKLLNTNAPTERKQTTEAPAKLKPVVGWLAVVSGPGRGQTFPLTYGMNPIGARVEQGVRLGFGDVQIADVQALIIYDHQRRKFLVHHKGGRTATFLNGEPVLKLTAMTPNQELVMGRTKLRFVPLCGPDFDWTQK